MNGCHGNGGNPGAPRRCGFKVAMDLHIENAEGLDDAERQAKHQEGGKDD